jgi:hypothetical protein
MGIAGDPMLRHHTCETAAGYPVFLIPGDVYDAKKKINLYDSELVWVTLLLCINVSLSWKITSTGFISVGISM